MKQLVLASSNPGKLREFGQMFAPLGIEIIPQSALGIAGSDEPHATFVENALAKARHAGRAAGLPALADDSGICVRALGGEPGVHSARFASTGDAQVRERAEQDALNNARLLALLRGKEDRAAHYACVIVLLRHAADPEPLVADGTWHGEIIDAPRGSNGFGYDPYFLVPDLARTAAELAADQKNALSHRGKALRRLFARLKEGD
jgi:XTP/dITP diphosphohydrolase